MEGHMKSYRLLEESEQPEADLRELQLNEDEEDYHLLLRGNNIGSVKKSNSAAVEEFHSVIEKFCIKAFEADPVSIKFFPDQILFNTISRNEIRFSDVPLEFRSLKVYQAYLEDNVLRMMDIQLEDVIHLGKENYSTLVETAIQINKKVAINFIFLECLTDKARDHYHNVIIRETARSLDLITLMRCFKNYSYDKVLSLLETNRLDQDVNVNKMHQYIQLMSNKFEECLRVIQLFSTIWNNGFDNFRENLTELKTITNKLSAESCKTIFDFLFERHHLRKVVNELQTFQFNTYFQEQIAKKVETKDFDFLLCLLMNRMFIKNKNFHALTLLEGFLTCAQIATRKKDAYIFDPVVLEQKELEEFLTTFTQCHQRPFRKRCLLCGQHWQVLDIEMNVDGKISILAIDSMGNDKQYIKDLLSVSIRVLEKKPYPYIIFYDLFKRQGAESSCAFFSLNDLQHLFTLERYLPASSVFEYLETQNKTNAINSALPIRIPLSLLRNAQSRDVFSRVEQYPLDEKAKATNKAGKTALTSLLEFYKTSDPPTVPPSYEGQNDRLLIKSRKMVRYNLEYLLTHGIDTALNKMQDFSLAAFKAEVVSINKGLESPPPRNRS